MLAGFGSMVSCFPPVAPGFGVLKGSLPVLFALCVTAAQAVESITVGVGSRMLNAISSAEGKLSGDLAPLYTNQKQSKRTSPGDIRQVRMTEKRLQ